MHILDDLKSVRIRSASIYLTAEEAEELSRQLIRLLKNPEANEHFHVYGRNGMAEISCSIVTESKLHNLDYTSVERDLLAGK